MASMRTVVVGLLLSVTLATGPMLAQGLEPAAAPQGRGEQKRATSSERLFVDSIVASVNDSSILQSKLFQAAAGEIAGRELEGGRMSLDQIKALTIAELRNLVSDYQMAQSARSFGNFPPDRFDAILNSELDRDQQDRVREVGTPIAFSEELRRTGQTWQTYRDNLRIEKLTSLAKSFAIYERLNKQANLYLTPRMLRETYQEVRSKFVREASAQIDFIVFQGADARAKAEAAVEHWRTYNWTAREVAQKFSPGATPGITLQARSLPPELRAFALAGPTGKVTDPIREANGSYKVAKIVEHITARDGHFEDPEVQAEVREIARRKVILEFGQQAQQRARDRTKVWVYIKGQTQQLPMR